MNSSQKLDFNDRFIPTGMNLNSVYIADNKYYAPPSDDWDILCCPSVCLSLNMSLTLYVSVELYTVRTMFLTDRRILGSSAPMTSTLCL